MATSDLGWSNDLYGLPSTHDPLGLDNYVGSGRYTNPIAGWSPPAWNPQQLPVTPRPAPQNLDEWLNLNQPTTYTSYTGHNPGGNGTTGAQGTRANYTQRYNSDGPMPAAGSYSYNNYGPTNYSNGVGAMAGQIAGGMNMLGGGTNLYGNYGAAVVPAGGVIFNGGGGGGGTWGPKTYQQAYGSGGGGGQQMSLGQQLASEITDARNKGNAANEKRYNDILGGDQAGVQDAMMNWLKSTRPNAKPEVLAKLAANPAMQARFDQANPGVRDSFGGYQDLYKRGMGYLQGQGDQAKKDINQSYKNLNSRQQQQLAARGLLNSTISQTMQNGVERKRQDSLNTLRESVNRQYLDTDSNLTKSRLDFMERRTDKVPDPMQYAQLMMQLGQGGYLGNGSGGSYGQQTGVGTMINGVPMVYGGSYRKDGMPAQGLNATSGYSNRW